MAKTLKQFKQGYTPRSADEKKFVDKHTVQKTPDANGNGDDVFNAKNVKMFDREIEHGYNPGSDEEVYEETNLEEKKLTAAEMKKREEVAKAIERENPNMPMAKKMAIATATAKKVAEETGSVEEGLMGVIGKVVASPAARAVGRGLMAFGKKTLQNAGEDMFPDYKPGTRKKLIIPTTPAPSSTKESKDVPFEGPLSKPDQHGPKSRAKHLAKMAMKKAMEKGDQDKQSLKKQIQQTVDQAAKEAAAAAVEASKKKVDEAEIKDYLISLYANQLSEEDNQALQEMLETDEGTKVAFMISMMVNDETVLDEMMKKSEKYSHRGFLNKLKQNNTGA